MEFLTWTYFFRRLMMNPSYYGLENASMDAVNLRLSELVMSSHGEPTHLNTPLPTR